MNKTVDEVRIAQEKKRQKEAHQAEELRRIDEIAKQTERLIDLKDKILNNPDLLRVVIAFLKGYFGTDTGSIPLLDKRNINEALWQKEGQRSVVYLLETLIRQKEKREESKSSLITKGV